MPFSKHDHVMAMFLQHGPAPSSLHLQVLRQTSMQHIQFKNRQTRSLDTFLHQIKQHGQ
jgi:hypothetical protein